MTWLHEAPVLAIASGYLSLVLYWYLRVVATSSGSYKALSDLQGSPGAIEKGVWIALLAAGALILV